MAQDLRNFGSYDLLLISLLLIAGAYAQTVTGTHDWDCSGAACDSATLDDWDERRYLSAPQYAPQDPGNSAVYG